MEELIERAKLLNPKFKDLTIQQQFDFIKGNLDMDISPEDVQVYYDMQWACPYDELILERMKYANRY